MTNSPTWWPDSLGPRLCETVGVRVSTKSDYALRALIELAARGAEHPVSAEDLGIAQGIPHHFLQAILADLRKSGLVRSQRGQGGGWLMERAASDVTVADVIRAVDGPLVSVYDHRPEDVTYNDRAATLQHVWIAARSGLREVLEQVSIQALVDQKLPAPVAERANDDDAWRPR